MRIAIIAPPWVPIPPPLYGGIESVVHTLAVGLDKLGHDVLLFTTGDATCPVTRKSVFDTPPPEIGSVTPELQHVIAAYDWAHEFGADIVHDHTVVGPLYAARFPGLRVFTTLHGPVDSELREIYLRYVDAAKIVAISHAQRRAEPDLAVEAVIHHGIDAESYPFSDRPGEYCLFLGRMVPEKGAARAIEVAKKAGVPLKIAGKMREAKERAFFESEVAPHVTGSEVAMVGEVELDEKLALLSGARCLLFPIDWNEPFGLVMLEALACGTPVLAFPRGAVPEVVEHGRTGFLCKGVTEMAEVVGKVDELERSECRKAVEGHFSARRMVADYARLFENALRP